MSSFKSLLTAVSVAAIIAAPAFAADTTAATDATAPAKMHHAKKHHAKKHHAEKTMHTKEKSGYMTHNENVKDAKPGNVEPSTGDKM